MADATPPGFEPDPPGFEPDPPGFEADVAPIDQSRPILNNADGSFSTERTITVEADGRHFVIPTIVGGQERSEDEAVDLWRQGKNGHVGVFATADEAEGYAVRRSEQIGKVRGPQRTAAEEDQYLGALLEAGRTKEPSRWAGLRGLNQRTGIPVDILNERYDEFRQKAEASKYDPARFRAEHPALAQWVLKAPGRAPLVQGDESLLKWAGRVWDALGELADPNLFTGQDVAEDLATTATAMGLPLGALLSTGVQVGKAVAGDAKPIADRAAAVGEAAVRRQETRELNPLAATEGVDRLQIIGDKWGRARLQSDLSRLGVRQMYLDQQARNDPGAQAEADANRLEIERIRSQVGIAQDYGANVVEQLALDVTEGLASQVDSLQALGAGVGVGAAGGALVGGATGALAAGPAGVIPGAGAGAKKGAAIGARLFAFAQSARLESGNAYLEMLDATDDKGEPVDPEVAMMLSAAYGIAAGGVELATLGPEMRAFGPLGEAIRGGKGIGWLKQAMKDRGKAGLLKSMARDWAAAAGAEGAEGFVQSSLNFFATWTAKGTSAGELQRFDAGEMFGQALEAGRLEALGGGAMATAGASFSLATNLVSAHQSRRSEVTVNAAGELLGNALAKASPGDAASLLGELTGQSGEPVTHAHVDPDQFLDAIEGDPSRKEQEIVKLLGPTGPQQVVEAMQQRLDQDGMRTTLRVEMAKVMESWDVGLFERMKPHMVTAENTFTPGERALYEKAISDEARLLSERSKGTASLGALEKHFSGLDDTQRATELFSDPTTGLLNEGGIKNLAPPADRPMLVVFDLEGGKLLNDQFGHQALDGGYRVMAEQMRKLGIQDGAKVGGSLMAYVRDEAHAKEIAFAMRDNVDKRLRVTYGVTGRGETWEASKDAAFNAANEIKTTLRGAGKLGQRKVAPAAFSKGLPLVSEKEGEPGIPMSDPQVQKVIAKATKKLEATAKKLAGISKGVKPAQMTAEQLTAYEGVRDEAFRRTFFTSEGLLNYAGRLMAQKLNPKAFTASADLRAFAEMDAAFGTAETDAINDYFEELVVFVGGGDYDAWHQSGDEYGAQHDSEAKLKGFWADLKKVTDRKLFVVHRADGSIVVQKGLSFAVGVGKDYATAEAQLKKAKEDQTDVSRPQTFATAEEYHRAAREGGWESFDLVDVRELSRARSARRAGEARGRGARSREGAAQERAAQRIAQQEAFASGLDIPLFRSPEEAGMQDDPEAWKAYQKHIQPSVELAAQAVRKRMARDDLAREEAFKRDEFKRFKEQAAEEWKQRDDVRAAGVVFDGEVMLSDGTTVSDPEFRLDSNAVKAALHDLRGGGLAFAARNEALEALSRRLKLRTKAGGADPDAIAKGHGYDNAAAMFEAIIRIPERKAEIERRAQELMVQAHPHLEATLEELREEARLALHAPGTLEQLYEEIKALHRKLPGMKLSPLESIRLSARMHVEGKSLRDLKPYLVRRREQAAANKAIVEVARGNNVGAYHAKQLHAQHAAEWSAMTEAVDERGKFERLAKSMTKDAARARLGKASPAHRDVSDTLLEALGFMEPIPGTEQRASLGELAKVMEDNADDPIDTAALEAIMLTGKKWQDLTVGEMWTVHDALRQINASARNLTRMKVGDQEVDVDEVIDSAIRWMETSARTRERAPRKSTKSAEPLRKHPLLSWESWEAMQLKPEFLLGWLGESIDSPLFRAVMLPLQQSKHNAVALGKEILKPLTEAFEAIPADLRARLREDIDGAALFPNHIDEPAAPDKRFEVLMMLLNIGNASNAERLAGRGVTRTEVIAAARDIGVTKEELAWLQSLHDIADTKVWPKMKALAERDQGVAPPKIEADSYTIQTPTGPVTMRGGYWPAVYDSDFDTTGQIQADITTGPMPTGMRPATSRSSSKKRAEKHTGIISLEPSVIQGHFFEVIHDLAYRESLRQASRILLDPRMQKAMGRHIGHERIKILRTWLQDVGRGGNVVDTHASLTKRVLRGLKSNLVVSVLAHSLRLATADLVTYFGAGAGNALKTRHLASGLALFMRSPAQVRRFVMESSGEMKARKDDVRNEFDKKVRSITARGGKAGQFYQWQKDRAFWMQEISDMLVSTPLWYSAYRQAHLFDGRSHEDAVTFADSIVRNVMPSHYVLDKSEMQRDSGLVGALTVMFGYMNQVGNRKKNLVRPALVDWVQLLQGEVTGKHILDTAKTSLRAVGGLATMTLVEGMIAEIAMGRGPEEDDGEDDDERWYNWAVRKAVMAQLNPIPLGVGALVESGLMGKAPSFRASPGFSSLEAIGRVAVKAVEGRADPEAVAWEAARALGMGLAIPTQPIKWAEYLSHVMRGDNDAAPTELASDLVYGERPGDPANPISLISGD